MDENCTIAQHKYKQQFPPNTKHSAKNFRVSRMSKYRTSPFSQANTHCIPNSETRIVSQLHQQVLYPKFTKSSPFQFRFLIEKTIDSTLTPFFSRALFCTNFEGGAIDLQPPLFFALSFRQLFSPSAYFLTKCFFRRMEKKHIRQRERDMYMLCILQRVRFDYLIGLVCF